MYLVERMTDIVELCCALNYNKELTVDSLIITWHLIKNVCLNNMLIDCLVNTNCGFKLPYTLFIC